MDTIIELLKNTPENTLIINNYVRFLQSCLPSDKVRTRQEVKILTIACRLWQLHYCIFTIIYAINGALITDSVFLHILCKSVIRFYTDTTCSLYDYIAQNTLPTWPASLCYIEYEDKFKHYISTNSNTYLCLYGIDKITKAVFPGSIAHYFTIIKSGEDYFITSSYGSSHVCAPYNIAQISNIDEFYDFCDNLKYKSQNPKANISVNENIIIFMEKYFFANPVKKRHEEDDIEFDETLRPLWITPKSGVKKEINYIIINTAIDFNVALIPNYEELVRAELFTNSELHPYIPEAARGKRKHKSKKHKSKKHKSKKHKSKKHKSKKHKSLKIKNK
jgi:hypothetical protein